MDTPSLGNRSETRGKRETPGSPPLQPGGLGPGVGLGPRCRNTGSRARMLAEVLTSVHCVDLGPGAQL